MQDALTHLLPDRGKRLITIEEHQQIESVLDAAEQWASGATTWMDAARVGELSPHSGRASTGYTRFVALMNTSNADPRRIHLRKLLDRITLESGYTITSQGTFTADDWHQHDGARSQMGRYGAEDWEPF